MTYKFKLSRRLAQAHLAALAMIAAACSDGRSPTAPVDAAPVESAVNTSSLASCANEPSGFTSVSNQPFDAPPPLKPSVDVNGWRTQYGLTRLSSILDPTSPSSGTVIQGRFPKGLSGGVGPFRTEIMFSQNFSSVYMCLATKLSSNFTTNGNAGVKFGFLGTPYQGGAQGTNHYFNLYPKLGINLQSTGAVLNRGMTATFSMANNRNTWHTVEYLVVGNSLGKTDGIGRIWVDGRLALDKTDIKYFYPNQAPKFSYITWNPTYGGGTNPVPYDLDQWIDNWYISGK